MLIYYFMAYRPYGGQVIIEEEEGYNSFLLFLLCLCGFLPGLVYYLVSKKKKTERYIPPQYPARYAQYMGPRAPLPKPTKKVGEVVKIQRGFEREGVFLKIGVKVTNVANLVITDVAVKLDLPTAVVYEEPKSGIINLGSIAPNEFQSAVFKLKPTRSIEGTVNGVVMYKDAKGDVHVSKMKGVHVSNVGSFLTSEGVSKDDIMSKLRSGGFRSNKSSIKFKGDAKAAYQVATKRVKGLILVEEDEKMIGDTYFAYACYIGKTKQEKFGFATEITVTGRSGGGDNVLTIAVYSNEDYILSGFFQEVFSDVAQHVKVIEQKPEIAEAICPNCGGELNLDKAKDRLVKCEYCEEMVKVPEWKS